MSSSFAPRDLVPREIVAAISMALLGVEVLDAALLEVRCAMIVVVIEANISCCDGSDGFPAPLVPHLHHLLRDGRVLRVQCLLIASGAGVTSMSEHSLKHVGHDLACLLSH